MIAQLASLSFHKFAYPAATAASCMGTPWVSCRNNLIIWPWNCYAWICPVAGMLMMKLKDMRMGTFKGMTALDKKVQPSGSFQVMKVWGYENWPQRTRCTLIRLDPRLRETKPLRCASGREASGGWENVWRIPGAKKRWKQKTWNVDKTLAYQHITPYRDHMISCGSRALRFWKGRVFVSESFITEVLRGLRENRVLRPASGDTSQVVTTPLFGCQATWFITWTRSTTCDLKKGSSKSCRHWQRFSEVGKATCPWGMVPWGRSWFPAEDADSMVREVDLYNHIFF